MFHLAEAHNASFNIEEESRLRERLGEDEQAHKFFIYMARKPSWWKEFKMNLKEFAEKLGEKTFLDSQKTQALVTRISP